MQSTKLGRFHGAAWQSLFHAALGNVAPLFRANRKKSRLERHRKRGGRDGLLSWGMQTSQAGKDKPDLAMCTCRYPHAMTNGVEERKESLPLR